MPFSFEPTKLPGVVIGEPRVYVDQRGFFMETYKKSQFADAALRQERTGQMGNTETELEAER